MLITKGNELKLRSYLKLNGTSKNNNLYNKCYNERKHSKGNVFLNVGET